MTTLSEIVVMDRIKDIMKYHKEGKGEKGGKIKAENQEKKQVKTK